MNKIYFVIFLLTATVLKAAAMSEEDQKKAALLINAKIKQVENKINKINELSNEIGALALKSDINLAEVKNAMGTVGENTR